ncbi:MAG: hypothetical protein ACREDO_08655 [Methyloceanibacter sp.]
MSKRGSAQFLLLSLRPRARLGLAIGAAVVFVTFGLVQTKGDFPLLDRSDLAQALHQSAWQRALAGDVEPAAWPWEAASEKNMSAAPGAKVPRLGLAAVLKQSAGEKHASRPAHPVTPARADKTGAEFGDVVIGDKITVTGADGSSHVYKVTGRRVVDPHLAESASELADGNLSTVSCLPLDVAGSLRLIIQASEATPAREPEPTSDQRKL